MKKWSFTFLTELRGWKSTRIIRHALREIEFLDPVPESKTRPYKILSYIMIARERSADGFVRTSMSGSRPVHRDDPGLRPPRFSPAAVAPDADPTRPGPSRASSEGNGRDLSHVRSHLVSAPKTPASPPSPLPPRPSPRSSRPPPAGPLRRHYAS